METAETAEGILRAALYRERPIYVSDSGDNTTAGAPGDLTLVLQAALDLPEPPVPVANAVNDRQLPFPAHHVYRIL